MTILPEVVIVILNWNGGEDTMECVSSLLDINYPLYEIVVIDNGSTDNSVAKIHERFPGVKIIENNENLGYAGGNNVGLRYSLERGSAYTLLLNNDTIVELDFLNKMVEAAEAEDTIGMTGPTVYYFDQPDLVWSAGGAIDWTTGRTRMIGLNETNDGQFGDVPRTVDFCTGCALLVKRSVIERIGLIDERFFLYYEETEWCERARRLGFRIVHVPTASIWHKISIDAQVESPQILYYMTRNRLLFIRTSRMGISAWLHTLLGDYLRTLLAWTLKSQWQHKRAQRKVMLRAILDAAIGRWGRRNLETPA